MFQLPQKTKQSAPPDSAQMLILCAIALSIGLFIPIAGSFVIIFQLFVDIFQRGVVNPWNIAIPVVVFVIMYSSFAAFQDRKRIWGAIICAGSVYTTIAINIYSRNQSISDSHTLPFGAALVFMSSVFLTALSVIYMIRPGQRPTQVFWWRPEPVANRLIRIAAVCFTGGLICVQNNVPIVGYALAFFGLGVSLYVYKSVK